MHDEAILTKEPCCCRCQCCGQYIFENQWRYITTLTKLSYIPNHAIRLGFLTIEQYNEWIETERAERRRGNGWYSPVAEYVPKIEIKCLTL